ncbi:MAG: sugar phosphate nucleotidyltransferase, partial [Acidimicrobiales bacterium]
MTDGVAGVVLAAGAGTRLRPLTSLRPKALCPVGNVPLVDLAVERVRPAVEAVAVNVHHGREAMEAHLSTAAVHVSVEPDEALGTAGALGRLRGWIDGRGVLVVNADAWCPGALTSFVEG